jgi:hypothetical protein
MGEPLPRRCGCGGVHAWGPAVDRRSPAAAAGAPGGGPLTYCTPAAAPCATSSRVNQSCASWGREGAARREGVEGRAA